jgi:outer membrane protein TolC
LKKSEIDFLDQAMATITAVEQAYFDLVYAEENVTVQQKALELAQQTLADNRKRVQVGTLAPLEEKQAESQVALSRADLISAQGTFDTQQELLKNLFTDKYLDWHSVVIEPVEKLMAVPENFDTSESWRTGLTLRPDLRQLKLDLERRDINLRYLKNQIYPAIDLVGSYGQNGLDGRISGVFDDQIAGRNPTYSAGVVVSIPLSTRGPRNAYKANKLEKQQAILRAKQLEQNILVQIDNAIKSARTSFERVDATRKARQYAEAALEAEQKKLEAGKSTSFVVLQLQRDLTTARSAEIRALSDYNKSLSQIAFTEGSTLERNHLNVK